MRQVIQNYKTGELKLEDVPLPELKPNGLLVRSHFSAISIGTEMMKVETAKMSLFEKAKAKPEEVKKVIQAAQQHGLLTTYRKVMNRLDSPTPLGYSASGTILQVGSHIRDLKIGDRVAIAGAGYANHSEINFVPRNLCVSVPDNVSLDAAAFTTIGSIAIQGIRQAKTQFGEIVAVIGLGLIGCLTAKILQAAGHVVIGFDIDKFKVEFCKKSGITQVYSTESELHAAVSLISKGLGVDAVLITTSTDSDSPVKIAGDIARDRARIVDVGITGMDLPRSPYYDKELEFIFSRSYGPGRYDKSYEEKGEDYPIGYVRWTENRNMGSFLQLISDGKLDIQDLITHRFDFLKAETVYQDILSKRTSNVMGVIFEYPQQDFSNNFFSMEIMQPARQQGSSLPNAVIGMIGAGNFAKSMLLPHLKRNQSVQLKTLVTASGISAKKTAQKYGFSKASTVATDVWKDESINTVVIATPHNLHAAQVIEALKNNKKVFVEKPLALDINQLQQVIGAHNQQVQTGRSPYLFVGYNRRFSSLGKKMKDFFRNRNFPLQMHYRVNAGPISKTHWIQDPAEGGGRIIGEMCHFIDFMQFISSSRPVSVFATCLRMNNDQFTNADNSCVTIDFEDGSVGSIFYSSIGDPSFPKEYIEVFGNASTAVLNDFSLLTMSKKNKTQKIKMTQDKGHADEIAEFIRSINTGELSPTTFNDVVYTSLATFAVQASLNTGLPVKLNELR